MRHLILTDEEGGTSVLATDSPASSYGIPVLQIQASDVEGDFGPSDTVGDLTAASIVGACAAKPERTGDELEAARIFLSQWPEGPQVEG